MRDDWVAIVATDNGDHLWEGPRRNAKAFLDSDRGRAFRHDAALQGYTLETREV